MASKARIGDLRRMRRDPPLSSAILPTKG